MVVVFCVYYPFMVIVWIVYDWVYHMIPHINVEPIDGSNAVENQNQISLVVYLYNHVESQLFHGEFRCPIPSVWFKIPPAVLTGWRFLMA